MERGKKPANKLQTLQGSISARANLAAYLGLQYGGDRDIYKALGYNLTLQYRDFLARYVRQDIAKAIIDRPVKATWQGELELIESEEANKTAFEKAWYDLNLKLKLRSLLARVDRLTGIGRYGVLLMGLDDVGKIEDYEKPVREGARKLLYVKPFGEGAALVNIFEDNPNDPRYGMPKIYNIEVADVSSGSSKIVKVHHTRTVHVVDDNLESEVFGTPRLECVFNRLMDLEKLVGGDAEMFWRGARPGFQGKVDKDYAMTPETKEGLKDQFQEYDNNLLRFLVTEGVDLEALAQQIADPLNHVQAQLQMISAVTGIPIRVLTGSERGELASSQDASEWKTYVQSRREDHAEPKIIRPFVDRLIELKILPAPEEYYRVDWLDLFSISEKERVEIGKSRASAIREYTTNPMGEALVPADLFLEIGLGLTQGQIDLAKKMRAEGITEESKSLMEDIMEITTPVPTGAAGGALEANPKKPVKKVAVKE